MRVLKTSVLSESLNFLESPRWQLRVSKTAGRVETTQVEINETRIEDGLSVPPKGENEFHELGSHGVPIHDGV